MKRQNCRLKGMVALLVFLLLGLVQSNPVVAAFYKIYPQADSYVDSQQPNTNFGTDPSLYAMWAINYLGSPLTQRTFLKFDLSGIPVNATVTAAKLYLYVTSSPGHPPLNANLFHVGDNWTESGITWNNQPVAGAYLGTHDYMDWGSYYAWNLFQSGAWNPKQDLTNRQISLMVRLDTEGMVHEYEGFCFSSRSGGEPPYLEVSTGSDVATPLLLLSPD